MNGVIIFADNKIFSQEKENRLFERFRRDDDFSVLPIDNLSCLESTVKSTSTFRACIIDWDFENVNIEDEDFIGVRHPQRTPMSILIDNPLYTLLYIYSERNIPDNDKEQLEQKFKEKIHFRIKQEDVDSEYRTIKADIQNFEAQNTHMNIPFSWSQAINQSAQKIFSELETANSFWIKEVKDTAVEDGGDPTTEIIDLFNNLLSEELVQNRSLRTSLDNINEAGGNEVPENTAKLYQRIYYSQLTEHAPIMTGDIFHFADESWGVLITPECEVTTRINQSLELDFLTFNLSDINDYLRNSNTFDRLREAYLNFKESKKIKLRKIFNNEVFSSHILPSFPAHDNIYNQLVVINFKKAYKTKSHDEYSNMRSSYKLNSPYIHQLRQRFISFFGKIGVPAIPSSLRDFNLNTQ